MVVGGCRNKSGMTVMVMRYLFYRLVHRSPIRNGLQPHFCR